MIPKIIHQIWFQGEEHIPEHLKVFHQHWIEKNPTFEVKVWDETTIGEEVAAYPDEEVRNMYANYRYMIQKIDLAKYIILYKHGGIYMDIDMDCIQGITDEFLGDNEVILSTLPYSIVESLFFSLIGHNPTESIINNAMIMVSPQNDIMLYTIEEAKKNKDSFFYYINKTLYVFSSVGPICLTFATKKVRPETKIRILDNSYFEGCSIVEVYEECNAPSNAIGLHLYESAWLSDTDKYLLQFYMFLAKYMFYILLILFVVFYFEPFKMFKSFKKLSKYSIFT